MATTQGVLNLYKKIGETSLERINRFRKKNPEYRKATMTYAGRLDPLAEGVLLILQDDEIKNKKKYLDLDKNYTFDIVLGIETDTYDMLGLIQDPSPIELKTKEKMEKGNQDALSLIKSKVDSLRGKKLQNYPPYSSKTVGGKHLFEWARQGKMEEIEIPKREIEIYDLKLLHGKHVSKKQFKKLVFDSISKVKGDFRQEKIIKKWKEFFRSSKRENFWILTFNIHCSSGTYIRSIAHELGKKLNIGAITVRIVREKIGNYSISEAKH